MARRLARTRSDICRNPPRTLGGHCTRGEVARCKSIPTISARPARNEIYCRSARASTLCLRRLQTRSLLPLRTAECFPKSSCRQPRRASHSVSSRPQEEYRSDPGERARVRIPARCRRGQSDPGCRHAFPTDNSTTPWPSLRTPQARPKAHSEPALRGRAAQPRSRQAQPGTECAAHAPDRRLRIHGGDAHSSVGTPPPSVLG
jgi:hypothetical protein